MLGNKIISGGGKCAAQKSCGSSIQEEASGKEQCGIALVLPVPVPLCSVEYLKKNQQQQKTNSNKCIQ